MLTWISIAAGVVVLLLARVLLRRFGSDRIDALAEKRRSRSLVVGRGQLIDGNRQIDVAMALTKKTLVYENADMEASLDLKLVQEVEYDTRVGTSAHIAGGQVLRLRSNSQCFEFLIPADAAARWRSFLPTRGHEAPAEGTPL